MRRLFSFLLLITALSACNGLNTATVLPAPSPTLTRETTATITPTDTPSPTPSLTPVPPSLILADFPLAVGAAWVYSAKISYQDPNDYMKLVTWTGTITDKVIDKTTSDDGSIVFTIQEDMRPTPPSDVWRQPRTFTYIVMGDGIFEWGKQKVYQWPIETASEWQTSIDFPGYETWAGRTTEVDTPYKKLDNCYMFTLFTGPDTTKDTFCRGIGFVKHFYSHHGTPQDEDFVLTSFTPGR